MSTPENPRKTIDEHCGKPEGSFAAFIQRQDEEQRETERDRKARTRSARNRAGEEGRS